MGKTYKDVLKLPPIRKPKSTRQFTKNIVGGLSNKKSSRDSTYNNMDLDEIGDDFEKFDRKRK